MMVNFIVKSLLVLICYNISLSAETSKNNTYAYVGYEYAQGTLHYDPNKDKVKLHTLNLGVNFDTNAFELRFAHINTNLLVNSLGFNYKHNLIFTKFQNTLPIKPYFKAGIGIAWIDVIESILSDEDDLDDSYNEYEEREDRRRQMSFSLGLGINIELNKKLLIYIGYDRYALIPHGDNINVTTLGFNYKFSST